MELLITAMILTSLLSPQNPDLMEAVKPVEVPAELTVERIAGEDRYETAVNVGHFLEYKGNKVVLASGENFPDALSAGVYANHIGGRLLLTGKEGIPEKVQEELSRIKPEYTAVIGGDKAVSDFGSPYIQESEVIFGKNRYETALEVAAKMPGVKMAYASGEDFPDALSAGPIASKEDMPLLLYHKDSKLGGEGIVFGGTEKIKEENIKSYKRISGEDRYTTAIKAAEAYGDFKSLIVVSGESFPDALSAMPLSKRYKAPILLTTEEGLPLPVLEYLMDKKIKHFIIVGGENAVSAKVEKQLNEIENPAVRFTLLTSPIQNGRYAKEVKEAVKTYHEQGRDHRDGSVDYDPKGIFSGFVTARGYRESERLQLDEEGIPKVRQQDEFHYNAVTVAQYALSTFGEYRRGQSSSEPFIKATDKLIDMMSEDGAFRYSFPWHNGNTGEVYEKGWISAMAQGHALSCFSRAYYLTKDPKYIEAGKKVYSFLILDKLQGGAMTSLGDLDERLSDKIFFEEYVSNPSSYTLNGYMFTLLGIYDWKILTETYPDLVGENSAGKVFSDGIESLCYIIHLYDVGGFTNYDLGYMSFDVEPRLIPGYHAIHIELLHNLYSITQVPRLKEYEERWIEYIEE